MSPNQFYTRLAEQIIGNTHDVIGTRLLFTQESVPNSHVHGIGPRLTPTTSKRKRQNRSVTNAFLQGKCAICKKGTKSKYTCSKCSKLKGSDYWECHSSTGRECFVQHLGLNPLSS